MPAPRRPPQPPPPKPRVETDLKTLADAANDAAKREAAQWLYFVTIMITLAALVGSTTHRVLFLEEPVRVPFLGVELPLLGFYVVVPSIFVVLHFYTLAQLRPMARKLHAFLDELDRQAGDDAEARQRALQRLDSFSVVQLLVLERYAARRFQVALMAWTTLAIAPVLLLLFIQLRFLPYQAEWITWWHRILLLADLLLIYLLWPNLAPRKRLWAIALPRTAAAGVVLLFSIVIATIPGEAADRIAPRLPGVLPAVFADQADQAPLRTFFARLVGQVEGPPDRYRAPRLPAEPVAVGLRRALFDGEVDAVTQRPASPLSRRLVLPDEDFVPEDDARLATMARTRVLRGRNLQYAVLDRADLRKVDLTGASLQGASLVRARLQGAVLERAALQGARLDEARLENARLERAQLQGASLFRARLQGADLGSARLLGTKLDQADLDGAALASARLQGASLVGASLRGAVLAGAELQGAGLGGASLQGAHLPGAHLQGAGIHGANIQAAYVVDVRFWRVEADVAPATADAVIIRPNFDGTPPCPMPSGYPARCAPARSWDDWVELWLQEIPAGRARDEARGRFGRLVGSVPHPYDKPPPDLMADADRLRREWATRRNPESTAVTRRVGDLACAEPAVARAVLQQIDVSLPAEGPGAARSALAARLADPQRCPAARALTEDERARLAEIAEVRP